MKPVCSNCGELLEISEHSFHKDLLEQDGPIPASAPKFMMGWYGTICTRCHTVYCQYCQEVNPVPCPNCGEDLKPATVVFYEQITPAALPPEKKFEPHGKSR